jgi:hypothetical protein
VAWKNRQIFFFSRWENCYGVQEIAMSDFKNQHYLPAAYLKQFSADKNAGLTRKSQIWRFDGKTSILVSAESQCREKYFYSREQAKAVEEAFGVAEGSFAECAKKIRDGKPPADSQFFGLIGTIFDLHLRNPAQENLPGKNNLDAYHLRLCGLKKRLVGAEDEPTDAEFLTHIENRWRVRVLRASDGNEFITSDNPSILMQNFAYAILPVTPVHMSIAYDCGRVNVVGTHTTAADEVLLKELQLSNAVECVYSSVRLNAEQEKHAAERLNRKTKLRSVTDEESWTPVIRKLTPGVTFSFLRNAKTNKQ